MNPEDFSAVNSDPRRIRAADEMYAQARNHLDKILDTLTTDALPEVYTATGGNDDASVTFDFLKTYIIKAEREYGESAHQVTILMCAAAMTRLVRASTIDPLAQLDKEISHDDH